LTTLELDVAEALLVRAVPCLVEVVHVELADKGGKVVVLEVPGEDLVGELSWLLHNEAVSFSVPADDMVQVWVLVSTKP
jgi:hypothetical protein